MTIRSRTARLDDASGELALSLAKLELEAAHGAPDPDEQIDFVRDLSRVAVEKRIRPWRLRAIQATILGLACLAGTTGLPTLWPEAPRGAAPILLGLAVLFLLLAGMGLTVYLRLYQREHQWLSQKEAAIRAGRTILDEG
ncbi:hypothetical protein [Geothrix paludis]|uniref:hypothetical protein n=1 Tax=Geothrix paludis TaxID=2922722 RepID=UPI001FAE1EFD|nr:hypothetical protein [Geothrix paludis]